MKNIIIAIAVMFVLLFGVATAIKAQTIGEFRKMPVEQKVKLVADSMRAMLTLTDEQYNKTYAVVIDAITKAQPIAKSDDSRVAKGQKLRTLMQEEEAKIKLILTQPQFEIFEAKKQNAITYYRQHLQDEKLVFNVPG